MVPRIEVELKPNAPGRFEPGFRISVGDGLILLAGGLAAGWAGSRLPVAGLLVGFVVGHFFLFCNVFRISRRPELIWAAVFSLSAALTLMTGIPGWQVTFAGSMVLAGILIAIEMRKPSYHGVGWKRINPNLREWWDRRRPARPDERRGD